MHSHHLLLFRYMRFFLLSKFKLLNEKLQKINYFLWCHDYIFVVISSYFWCNKWAPPKHGKKQIMNWVHWEDLTRCNMKLNRWFDSTSIRVMYELAWSWNSNSVLLWFWKINLKSRRNCVEEYCLEYKSFLLGK